MAPCKQTRGDVSPGSLFLSHVVRPARAQHAQRRAWAVALHTRPPGSCGRGLGMWSLIQDQGNPNSGASCPYKRQKRRHRHTRQKPPDTRHPHPREGKTGGHCQVGPVQTVSSPHMPWMCSSDREEAPSHSCTLKNLRVFQKLEKQKEQRGIFFYEVLKYACYACYACKTKPATIAQTRRRGPQTRISILRSHRGAWYGPEGLSAGALVSGPRGNGAHRGPGACSPPNAPHGACRSGWPRKAYSPLGHVVSVSEGGPNLRPVQDRPTDPISQRKADLPLGRLRGSVA